MNWKTIAIIFLVLFIVENILLGWGMYTLKVDQDKTNECYFDICGDYPDAYYEADVCSCYEYDMLGDWIITKEEYMP